MKTRKISPSCCKLLIEIADLALSCPSDVADIFVNWSPHCDALYVHAYIGGWKKEYWAEDLSFDGKVYLDYPAPGRHLAAMVRQLRKLIADAPSTLEARRENERKMKLACAERLRAEAEALA